MNRHKKYWLFQAIGWGGYALISFLFAALSTTITSYYLNRLGVFTGVGLLLSHFMRILLKKLNILDKPINLQIINTIIITLLFSLLSGFVIVEIFKYFNMEASSRFNVLSYSYTMGIYFSIWSCIYLVYHFAQSIRREEQQKIETQMILLELEARALRAQMNPHFIFNCLNSIKSLIQEDKKERSISYLTTFSKLIRTLFNNADKKQISLYDEIETCKLYLKLESLRFDEKFSYNVRADPGLDLKSTQIPALIIQPFVENAITHGIIPKELGGHIDVLVQRHGNSINVIIEDNGIGREASVQNKSLIGLAHQSKGVYLTQSRLQLDNLISKREVNLGYVDKKNANGIAEGTKAILTFKEQLS